METKNQLLRNCENPFYPQGEGSKLLPFGDTRDPQLAHLNEDQRLEPSSSLKKEPGKTWRSKGQNPFCPECLPLSQQRLFKMIFTRNLIKSKNHSCLGWSPHPGLPSAARHGQKPCGSQEQFKDHSLIWKTIIIILLNSYIYLHLFQLSVLLRKTSTVAL